MEFEVTEIKKLGSGYSRLSSLSLRLEHRGYRNDDVVLASVFTIHAVVPLEGFKDIQVGQKFKFERVELSLNERVVTNQIGQAYS